MTQPFVTRSQAAEYQGLDPRVIEVMAERYYEATRPTGSSYPPWSRAEETHRADVRRGIVAAVKHAERLGFTIRGAA